MKANEYERLKKQIESEYREKLNALEIVWKLSLANQNGQSSAPPSGAPAQGAKTGLARAMRDAIVTFTDRDFTLSAVEDEIHHQRPDFPPIRRQSMATAMGRLEKRGLVTTVSPGKGRTEAVYRLNLHKREPQLPLTR